MIARNLLRSLVVCLLAVTAMTPVEGARKPSNTYTLRVACFTATPKSPRLARAKADGKDILKQAPILPESGAPFVLDISTPTRFRKQMENASKDYDFFLTAGGSVSCDSGSVSPIDIPPSPDDLSKSAFKGEWTLTAKDPSTINVDFKELTLYQLLPGQTKVFPVQTVKTARVVSLNRTYMLSGIAKQQDGKTTLSIFVFCIVPGG